MKKAGMRIAFVAQPFDAISKTSTGSLAIWTHELSKKVGDNHEVTVYSRKGGHANGVVTIDGVRHVRISTAVDDKMGMVAKLLDRILRRLLRVNWSIYHRFYYFQWYYYLFYILAVSRHIQKSEIDVAVVLNFSNFLPIIKRLSNNTKTIIVMQCDWLIELSPEQISRRLCDANAVAGCSNYIADGVRRAFPQHAEKCFTLYNGSNPFLFDLNHGGNDTITDLRDELNLHDEKVVLFVGRVTPEKGVHILMEAMKRVWLTQPKTVLLVVGGFHVNPPSPLWLRNKNAFFSQLEVMKRDYRRYLLNLVEGFEKQVRFVGSVPHRNLVGYYGLCDVFVHPAVWNEPFGMILTEAMACQRPVVSTKVGGIPEVVVDGKTGLLTVPDDHQALADAIVRLLGDPDRRREMGAFGRERVKIQFSWERTAQDFENILEII